MKIALMALVVALATFQAAQVPQTPLTAAECKCSIDVTVKHASTGDPLSGVDVSLSQATPSNINRLPPEQITPELLIAAALAEVRANEAGSKSLIVTTGNDGHAVFRDLAEGNYNVSAQLAGYFSLVADTFTTQVTSTVPVGPASGQAGTRGTPRQPVQQITLGFVKGSIVAGRITDANRRPASGIPVGAYRVDYQLGNRVLTQVATTVQSDDRGEYRLFWLPPGEYYIRTAAPQNGSIADRSIYPSMTYYPGTLDPKQAVRVTARDGSEINGTDIGLPSSTGVTVSGTIVNTIADTPAGPRGQVSRSVSSIALVPRDAYFFENPTLIPNVQGATRANQTNNPDTTFEIKNVPPGTYDFYPLFNSGPQPTATGGTLPGYFSGRTPVEVGTENVTGIRSVIQPGSNLKIRVTVAGTAPATGQRGNAQPLTLANIRFQIRAKENVPLLLTIGARSQMPPPDADGVSTLTNLVDGHYFIAGWTGLPVDAYVSDVRLDSRSVFDDGVFEVAKNSQSTLDVAVSRGGGAIQGTVLDAKRAAVPGVRITLIPDPPRRQNALLYRTSLSGAAGGFNFNGVAPGNYKLFAWETNPAGAERDSEFMREYDLLGASVNVSVGIPLANIQVPVIPAKR